MAEVLDEKICKQMNSLVKLLTTSGKSTLNPDVMKKFKKICRTSQGYVKHAFDLLMNQLAVKHAEVRLSTYQMMAEIFTRSHVFREMLTDQLQIFFELTIGTDNNKPLPPPKSVAERLKTEVYRNMQLWFEKYGEAYKKLALGYEFLKTCKKVDFDEIQARVEAERRGKEEVEKKLERIKKEKVEKVLKEFADIEDEMHLCVTEVNNGIRLLMPHPDDFFVPLAEPGIIYMENTNISGSQESVMGKVHKDSHLLLDESGKTVKIQCDAGVMSAGAGDIGLTLSSGTGETELMSDDADKTNGYLNHSTPRSLHTNEVTEKLLSLKNVHDNSDEYCDEMKDDFDKNGYRDGNTEKGDQQVRALHFTSEHVSEDKIADGGYTIQEKHDFGDEVTEKCSDLIENGSAVSQELQLEYEPFEDAGNNFTQELGLFSRQMALTIDLGTDETRVPETEDNRDIIQGVREQYKLIKHKYLNKVKKFIQVLREYNKGQAEQLRQLSEMKNKLEDAMKKCVELEIATSRAVQQKESDSDEDFEDVPEKEGYEEDIPEHVKLEAAQATSSQGHSKRWKGKRQPLHKTQVSKTIQKSSKNWTVAKQLEEQNEHEPMAWKCNVAEKPSTSSIPPSSPHPTHKIIGPQQEIAVSVCTKLDSEKRKQKLLEKAPQVSFGIDLEHWECPDRIKVPVKVKYTDASRFWVPHRDQDDEDGGAGGSEEVAALTRRTFTYVRELEPVKWKCRAPMHDGKLCERMDRIKCPFHGTIIGRDEDGNPTDPKDIHQLKKNKLLQEQGTSSQSPVTWPEEVDKAMANPSSGKGKQKAKKRKYPNLTDVTKTIETGRSRLEAKIFKRSTLKKVNDALDAAAMKGIAEKFANQFNYCLK